MREPVVRMLGIEKIYPDGQYALRGVDLEVYRGEIHGVLGENGAGKTTLMRILYGEIRPTRGTIIVNGREVRFSGPWDAIREGIGMIYQHFSLIPSMTVAENIYLSVLALDRRAGYREVLARAEDYARALGVRLPYDRTVEELPVGVQQKIEIIKTLVRGARILILDEPTSVLTPVETQELFKILRGLRERGYTIIYISHKLREVKELTDRVTVLRRGRVVGTFETGSVSEEDLARMMVSTETPQRVVSRGESVSERPREAVLEVRGLVVRDPRGVEVLKRVSLEVYQGEILGIAGVQGNGQTELAETIAGLRRPEEGRILFMGRDITETSTSERYRMGIAYIPDSRSVGLVYGMSVLENMVLTRLRDYTGPLGLIRWGRAREDTERLAREFDIKTPSLETDVRFLSGGNQQRLLLAREISRGPRLVVVSEPTHGLDIASTRYVRDVLSRLRDRGGSVVLISTDLEEVLELSDRIAVMSSGRIVAVGRPGELTIEKIGMLIGGAG